MAYLLLTVSILCATLKGAFSNQFIQKKLKSTVDLHCFNAIVFLLTVIVLLCTDIHMTVSWFTALFAVVFAATNVAAQIYCLEAMRTGPMSYSTLIASCSMIIPSLCGAIFWHEGVRWQQLVGLILIVASFAVGTNRKTEKNTTKKWILYAVLSFLFCGFIGVEQKIHQTSVYKGELQAFLVISFAIMAVMSWVLCLTEKKKSQIRCSFSARNLPVMTMACAVGIFMAGLHKINLYLSGALPSMLFYPVANGGVILLTSIIAVLFFHERMNKAKLFGIIIGVLGISITSIS